MSLVMEGLVQFFPKKENIICVGKVMLPQVWKCCNRFKPLIKSNHYGKAVQFHCLQHMPTPCFLKDSNNISLSVVPTILVLGSIRLQLCNIAAPITLPPLDLKVAENMDSGDSNFIQDPYLNYINQLLKIRKIGCSCHTVIISWQKLLQTCSQKSKRRQISLFRGILFHKHHWHISS